MTLQTIRHQNLIPAPLSRLDKNTVVSEDIQLGHTSTALKQLVYSIDEHHKDLLTANLLKDNLAMSVLIYVRTNSAADSLAEKLNRGGMIAESVHGNKSERTKTRTLTNFRNRSTHIVVATESATSEIILEAEMIINYDLPLSAETYGKRIARHSDKIIKMFISLCDVREQARLENINRAFPGQLQLMEHGMA